MGWTVTFGRKAWTAMLACLLAAIAPAVAAQPRLDAPPQSEAPALPPSCPYDAAMQRECGQRLRVAIGFRDNLGDWLGPVEAAVRAHPLARVGWPSEFEIARSPDGTRELVLVDMFNPPLRTAYRPDQYAAVPNNYDVDAIHYEGTTGRPIALGRGDDAGFAARLDMALREIVRVRALNLFARRPTAYQYFLCIEGWDRNCPESGGSDTADLRAGDAVVVGIRNDATEPLYTYMLYAAPGRPLRLVAGSHDLGGAALDPGQLAAGTGDPVTLATGRNQFFIIRSREPVDLRVFDEATRSAGQRAGCETLLERTLCSALSGSNIAIPTDVFRWEIEVMNFYLSGYTYQRAGGGRVAAPGSAPWQVQIFSNQTYSWQQIEDDKKLQSAGKMLYLQQPFQRYHRCAGSLIATNIVLTAAHCVAKGPHTEGDEVLRTREIRVGTQDLRKGGAIYRIEAVVVHAGYRTTGQKDDIALLRIAPKRAAIAQTPIMLPDDVPAMRRVRAQSRMEILGWGYTEVVARGERHELPGNVAQFTEDRLRMAEMEAMDQAACRKIKGYGDIDRKICATTPSDRTEPGRAFSCRNDSGGPVIQQLNRAGQVVQIGVVSGGVGCGDEENGVQNPSLFVDLQLFTNWIAGAKKKLATVQNAVVKFAEP